MSIVNITAENDADFYRWFSYKTVDGVPINLTGAEMNMKVRKHAEDATVFIWLSTGSGIELTDPANGIFTVFIPQDELVRLSPGEYDHSLIATLNGVKTRVWSGTLLAVMGPTR